MLLDELIHKATGNKSNAMQYALDKQLREREKADSKRNPPSPPIEGKPFLQPALRHYRFLGDSGLKKIEFIVFSRWVSSHSLFTPGRIMPVRAFFDGPKNVMVDYNGGTETISPAYYLPCKGVGWPKTKFVLAVKDVAGVCTRGYVYEVVAEEEKKVDLPPYDRLNWQIRCDDRSIAFFSAAEKFLEPCWGPTAHNKLVLINEHTGRLLR